MFGIKVTKETFPAAKKLRKFRNINNNSNSLFLKSTFEMAYKLNIFIIKINDIVVVFKSKR
ncbi:hypothetical protein C0081_04210 [Cohaesibacter celericrescens]|uniref:Uncharacterized protein n=1 Tax=Cohaesibacter celericrescens TaxID=2067669 RepID=A0A2N5XVP8_9HYPH|nr:hypothetical protein C0081_04210 [Cohaesibacter celericrescens]